MNLIRNIIIPFFFSKNKIINLPINNTKFYNIIKKEKNYKQAKKTF